jgi:microcystin-dependent protein
VFVSVVATDPATLLGFGTWAALGAGRVLVGFDAGQTEFDALKETGGVKTVTLTAAQSGLPQHTHTQNAHTHTQNAHTHTQDAHSHTYSSQTATTGGASSYEHGAIDTSSAATESSISVNAATATNQNATAVNQDATAVNQNAGPTDAAQAHTNLQPYLVVRFWERTA